MTYKALRHLARVSPSDPVLYHSSLAHWLSSTQMSLCQLRSFALVLSDCQVLPIAFWVGIHLILLPSTDISHQQVKQVQPFSP